LRGEGFVEIAPGLTHAYLNGTRTGAPEGGRCLNVYGSQKMIGRKKRKKTCAPGEKI